MKRLLVLMIVGFAAAFGIWFGMRGASQKAASSSVTALLPRETIAFLHLPDLNRTVEQWHGTDLYKLWREPAMQEFLQKPLSRSPQTGTAQQKINELATLQMRDAFFAITAWKNDQPKMVGGFRFKGEREDAEKVIGQWRAQAQQSAPAAKRETIDYERNRIELMSERGLTLATVYTKDWFFAANDLDTLKALLDRLEKRASDAATTLAAEENFTAAFKKIPMSYAVFGYGRLDQYMSRLATKLPADPQANDRAAMLRQIKSIAGATTFEAGKIRDVLVVTMPKMHETPELTRSSLALATAESFLYGASFLQFPKEVNLPDDAPATGIGGFPAALQRMLGTLAASGLTLETWNSAFGSEFGVIGDWPATSRLPALLATLPVKDAEKANQIAAAMTSAAGEDSRWIASEEDGVRYYAQLPANPMIPIAPTIGISSQIAVLGLDRASVAAALKRSSERSTLATADNFKTAEGLVPVPQHTFWYLDAALLYTRLDATLRPMLIMGAAFFPAIADAVDLSKVPAPEVVTRHLSPIVVSQSYEGDSYRMESVGPVSIYHSAIGLAAVSGAGAKFYQSQMRSGAAPSAIDPDAPDGSAGAATAPPPPRPSPSPEEEP
jgi:hypothetical protein